MRSPKKVENLTTTIDHTTILHTENDNLQNYFY